MSDRRDANEASNSLVRFSHVSKSFRTARGRHQVALEDFSMSIPRGAIVGLLGPNGSGKTTALKSLLGLVRPDGGTIHAFGHPVPRDQHLVARRMGALIEGPAFTTSLTGERNLRLLGELHGTGRDAVADALELVGLTHAARRTYSGYSLGMKQRLGVAAALLSGPELLVLDEPMNGLDPEAVRDMRELLKRLRDERGMTVVVSSHILAEVELVCDWVTIVRHGRVICDSGIPELLARHSGHLVVRLADVASARTVLERHGHTVVEESGTAGLRVTTCTDGAEALRLLTAQGVYPDEVVLDAASLEDIYVTAIRDAARTAP
ncbi:ABC transporter ATP-binding protein [Streptomyces sp. NPDC091040]|uniref:ABC transporter ATP-binding protein n=1 Tax=Streptomyces sp. NPDC091040 TaxID=3365972 RepID=UPI0037F28185